MTNDTAHTYAYDAEGHVVSISTNGTTTLTAGGAYVPARFAGMWAPFPIR
jgi:hypothetical protein